MMSIVCSLTTGPCQEDVLHVLYEPHNVFVLSREHLNVFVLSREHLVTLTSDFVCSHLPDRELRSFFPQIIVE